MIMTELIIREFICIENLLLCRKSNKLIERVLNKIKLIKENEYKKKIILDKEIINELININNNNDINLEFHINNLKYLLEGKIKDNWHLIILCERELTKVEDEDKEYFNYCLIIYRHEKLEEINSKMGKNTNCTDLKIFLEHMELYIEKMRICISKDLINSVKEYGAIVSLKMEALNIILQYFNEFKENNEKYIKKEEIKKIEENIELERISRDMYFRFNEEIRKGIKKLSGDILKKNNDLLNENSKDWGVKQLDVMKGMMIFVSKYIVNIILKDNRQKINDDIKKYIGAEANKAKIIIIDRMKRIYGRTFINEGKILLEELKVNIKISNLLLGKIYILIDILKEDIENLFKRVNEEAKIAHIYLNKIEKLEIEYNKQKDMLESNMSEEEKKIFEKKCESLINKIKENSNMKEDEEENEEIIKETMNELERLKKKVKKN